MNNSTKIVNELIYDYNLNIEEAIDIEDLIRKMNIRLVSTELEEGILGASKVEGLKRLIVISSKVYNEEQKFNVDVTKLRCYEFIKNKSHINKSMGTLGGGNHFIEIQEIIDDFTEYTGLRNFVSGNGRVTRFLNNPTVMRVVSAVWLITCILLPIFVMLESYASDGYVSFQLIAFYIMWAFIMLVPFFNYHFVNKNRGDK